MARMDITIPPPKKLWHYLILPVSIPCVVAFVVAWNLLFAVWVVAELFGVRERG